MGVCAKNIKFIQNPYYIHKSYIPHINCIQGSSKSHIKYKIHTKLIFHTKYIQTSLTKNLIFIQRVPKVWLYEVCKNFVFWSAPGLIQTTYRAHKNLYELCIRREPGCNQGWYKLHRNFIQDSYSLVWTLYSRSTRL